MENLYPWHQIAWDISVAEGMTDFQTCTGFNQQIADELCADILSGKLSCWMKDSTPYRNTISYFELRKAPPHLTETAANHWLKSRAYLFEWAPKIAEQNDLLKPQLDYKKLATPQQLIQAFGASTGMNKEWFSKNHSPKLNQARIVKGKPGLNGMPAMYCPMDVMIWLTSTRRGKKLPEKNGWALLEGYFPEVYQEHATADPR